MAHARRLRHTEDGARSKRTNCRPQIQVRAVHALKSEALRTAQGCSPLCFSGPGRRRAAFRFTREPSTRGGIDRRAQTLCAALADRWGDLFDEENGPRPTPDYLTFCRPPQLGRSLFCSKFGRRWRRPSNVRRASRGVSPWRPRDPECESFARNARPALRKSKATPPPRLRSRTHRARACTNESERLRGRLRPLLSQWRAALAASRSEPRAPERGEAGAAPEAAAAPRPMDRAPPVC